MSENQIHTIQLPEATSSQLLAAALPHLLSGDRAQVLVERGDGVNTVNKIRVALSRSRKRNLRRGRKIPRFTLIHSIYPYTAADGTRFDAVVLSIQKSRTHRALELLDDLMDRTNQPEGLGNVA
jgi:hypothetical protein